MDKNTGQTSVKNIVIESFSLNPSALITLFEIDISDLGFNQGIISQTEIDLQQNTVFRFHNNINLTTKSIFWKGQEYVAAPIAADGFETNLKGTLPTPKLSMTVSDDGIPALAALKERLFEMGDIVGGKITRIRTYSRFLDAANFIGGVPPANFFPDPNAELPRDIFFIDRKSIENKNFIEYELSSIFDVEGIKLPGGLVSQDCCRWQYRGEGCLYEYASRKNAITHGDGILPISAPPVATALDEPINTLITGVSFVDKGAYNRGMSYNKGESVFLAHRGINYYFVSKIDNNLTVPPDDSVWIQEDCSKKMRACKMRFQNIGSGSLPIGAYPSVNRFK